MKRILVLFMTVGLVVGAVATAEAGKKKPKPVATALYLHGATVVGENDSLTLYAEAHLPMDETEPAGSEPKSRWIANYLVGPNTQCSGNLLFPVWSGALSGQIKGDVKLTLNTIGTPGDVVVRIWPDIPPGTLCNSDLPPTPSTNYVEPSGEVVVTLPPGAGTVEAIMEDVDLTALGSVIIQISPAVLADIPSPGGAILNPFMSRILYDTADFASVLEFSCIPASGTSCTP